MIIIVFGLPGSGKTYFAARLAKKLGALHIGSDKVRKGMVIRDYSDQSKRSVYLEMLRLLELATNSYEHVILDTTLSKPEVSLMVREKVQGLSPELLFIETVADEKLVKKRLSKPRPDSDADYQVYVKVKKEFQPFHGQHLTLQSTNTNIDEMIRKALNIICDFNEPTTDT